MAEDMLLDEEGFWSIALSSLIFAELYTLRSFALSNVNRSYVASSFVDLYRCVPFRVTSRIPVVMRIDRYCAGGDCKLPYAA
jgi:hypothetical protein